jgi:3-methyladenine DNA glycosylase AlkC
MKIRSWTQLMKDRKKWSEIVEQAKTDTGLWCQEKKKKKLCLYRKEHPQSQHNVISVHSKKMSTLETKIDAISGRGLLIWKIKQLKMWRILTI